MTTPSSELDLTMNDGSGVDTMARRSAERPDRAAAAEGGHLRLQQGIAGLIIFGPLVGVVAACIALVGHGVSALDIVLLVVFYGIAGHGLTVGFHRLLTHRAFQTVRWVKVTLALAGSLGFEGSVIGWVANHRRHHAYTDQEGDPHSPYAYGSSTRALTRGALHAHVGWLFQGQPTCEPFWAPDLVADPDLVIISRLFPLWCGVSLAAPMLLGFAFTHTLAGAIGGLVWGGLVRMFLLHQSTFAVNSVCHLWGKRPFATREADKAANFAPLAILSMGENWHNAHHSKPNIARYGVGRGQLDSTARIIWILERFGLATEVKWLKPRQATLAGAAAD